VGLPTGRDRSSSFYSPISPIRQVSAAPLRELGKGSPVFRDGCPGGRHRDLGGAPRYERGEGDADRKVVLVEDSTREHEPERVSGALWSGRNARVGSVEAETVRALDGVCLSTELTGQGYEVSSIAADGYGSPQTSSGVRRQCRRDEEASPLEVEEGIHAPRIYASRRSVVEGVRGYCSGYNRGVARAERNVW
jgi:hypothetical protein